jgi:hypothetical protein
MGLNIGCHAEIKNDDWYGQFMQRYYDTAFSEFPNSRILKDVCVKNFSKHLLDWWCETTEEYVDQLGASVDFTTIESTLASVNFELWPVRDLALALNYMIMRNFMEQYPNRYFVLSVPIMLDRYLVVFELDEPEEQ